MQKLPEIRQVVLFLKDDVCELEISDKLSGERIEWLEKQLREVTCGSLRAVCICISSEKNEGRPLKTAVWRWAQDMGGRLCRAAGEAEQDCR